MKFDGKLKEVKALLIETIDEPDLWYPAMLDIGDMFADVYKKGYANGVMLGVAITLSVGAGAIAVARKFYKPLYETPALRKE